MIFAETPRLILRALEPEDVHNIFLLDSNPEVHRYLGNNTITSPEQARHNIDFIREQYLTNGIGRWAVIEKETQQFAGWSGLKLITEVMNGHQNFHDIGYRLLPEYWNKGYATESAMAALHYAFNTMRLDVVYGLAHIENIASQRVLNKIGLTHVNNFMYNDMETCWMKMNNPKI